MRLFLLLFLGLVIVLPVSGQVVINEFNTGTPDFVEIRNNSASPVSIAGWSLRTYQSNGGTPSLEPGLFSVPGGTTIPAYGTYTFEENGSAGAAGTLAACSVRTGYNFNWTSTRNVIVILRDGSNVAQDYVYRNTGGGPGGSPNLPTGQSWSGAFTATGDACSRNQNNDTDSAADWTTTSAPSPCSDNPGQGLPSPITLSISTTGAGDINASITSNPAMPGAQYWNLVSFQNYNPTGSGPLFGVGLDVLPQIAGPSGTIFRDTLSGAGSWSFVGGPGTIPPGLFVEVVTVVWDQGPNQIHASDVVEVQF